MNDVEKSVVIYGKALTQAIKAFDVLEPKAGWFERMLIKLLRKSYRQGYGISLELCQRMLVMRS
jgi:hypothetical protein